MVHQKMCIMCQAQGTVKRQYGFRVMDEQCENCNGEGCIITRPPSTADKIAKVEALIANATDLESLQRCACTSKRSPIVSIAP